MHGRGVKDMHMRSLPQQAKADVATPRGKTVAVVVDKEGVRVLKGARMFL